MTVFYSKQTIENMNNQKIYIHSACFIQLQRYLKKNRAKLIIINIPKDYAKLITEDIALKVS